MSSLQVSRIGENVSVVITQGDPMIPKQISYNVYEGDVPHSVHTNAQILDSSNDFPWPGALLITMILKTMNVHYMYMH